MPNDEEAERWLEKRVNPTPSRMDEAIRSLACVAQRRPNPDRRVSIPGAGAPAPRSPKRAGLPDAQGIADAVLVSGAAAASNEEAAWLSAGSPAAPVGAACLGLPKLWPPTPASASQCQPRPIACGPAVRTRRVFETGRGAVRRVVEMVPSSPLSPQARQRQSELDLQEQLQAQLRANQEQLRLQVSRSPSRSRSCSRSRSRSPSPSSCRCKPTRS